MKTKEFLMKVGIYVSPHIHFDLTGLENTPGSKTLVEVRGQKLEAARRVGFVQGPNPTPTSMSSQLLEMVGFKMLQAETHKSRLKWKKNKKGYEGEENKAKTELQN